MLTSVVHRYMHAFIMGTRICYKHISLLIIYLNTVFKFA